MTRLAEFIGTLGILLKSEHRAKKARPGNEGILSRQTGCSEGAGCAVWPSRTFFFGRAEHPLVCPVPVPGPVF
jgi:hypothetical protein